MIILWITDQSDNGYQQLQQHTNESTKKNGMDKNLIGIKFKCCVQSDDAQSYWSWNINLYIYFWEK